MDVNALLPATRTPADYLRVVDDPRLDADGLGELARSPYSFVRLAVARQPRAGARQLSSLLDGAYTDWEFNALLVLLADHPRADRQILLAVLERVTTLLHHPGKRPYAAALALAGRAELRPEEIRGLGQLPGASRRMRRGLRAVLAARTPVTPRRGELTG
ncbi:hypothetical protein Val02_48860 [Virgisporangium aliadipatigenens]|uniref:Uncharacterized protein n=1 Tax=Virgisporangium aliadipatigenens TaxID=741659 RepID=A0A8J3YQ76_9ACTN|nr:hypothetical protein [Virgisporangium aliadipatigenens]GIJ48000.1 hypothetical protein Val02_48860 [Virgisporangium aliadipatigenens]